MESKKDPVPWLYVRIAGVDLGRGETEATEDGKAKRSLFRSTAAVLLCASFTLTLACGPESSEEIVVPVAAIRSKQVCDVVDGGDPGVAQDGDDTCTATTGVGAAQVTTATTVGTVTTPSVTTASVTMTASATTTVVPPPPAPAGSA
jgi:hypothetical protein